MVNYLEDWRNELLQPVVRRWSRKRAQQRHVVTSGLQTRTQRDEWNRVRLGTTHGSQQNVVTRRGIAEKQNCEQEDRSIQRGRHLQAHRHLCFDLSGTGVIYLDSTLDSQHALLSVKPFDTRNIIVEVPRLNTILRKYLSHANSRLILRDVQRDILLDILLRATVNSFICCR